MRVEARLQPWMIRTLAFVRKDVVEIIRQPFEVGIAESADISQ